MSTLMLPAKELKLGDTVRLSPAPFADAIVAKVTPDMVTFQRPYGTCRDFSYGEPAQVIVLTGMETFSVFTNSTSTYQVLERREIR